MDNGLYPLSMDSLALNIQILSENTLKHITKGPLVKFALNCDDSGKVSRVWQSLQSTLAATSISNDHIAEACNAVSAFLDAGSRSSLESTRQLVVSVKTWMTTFDIFLSRYEDFNPKPLKQLMGSLVTILARKFEDNKKIQIEDAISKAILPSVLLGEPKSLLKGSIVALEMLIRKKAISSQRIIILVKDWLVQNLPKWIQVFQKEREALLLDMSMNGLDLKDPSDELAARIFVFGIVTHTSTRSMAGTSGGVLEQFLQKLRKETPGKKASKLWVAPIRHIILHNLDSFEALSTQILPPIFTGDPEGFVDFISTLPLESLLTGDMTGGNESEFMLLFVALQIGKKINLVHEDYDPSFMNKNKTPNPLNVVLKSEIIGKFLLHREANIRVAALSLLITAFATTKPMTTVATDAILRGLPSIHADSDSYSRSEIMSITRKLLVRLRSGIKELEPHSQEDSASDNKFANQSKSDQLTKDFLTVYIIFLEQDLCVTASYARHITSLKALKLLLESGLDPLTDPSLAKGDGQGHWKIQMELYDDRLLRLLIDLLLDPFEEVRQTSLAIINLFPSKILLGGGLRTTELEPSTIMLLPEALARAEDIASNTSRADHADTVARIYHVLFSAAQSGASFDHSPPWWATKISVVNTILAKLEERLGSSRGLFNSSMRDAPLHGYMSGLRYIISTPNFYSHVSSPVSSPDDISMWLQIHRRIVSICDRIWEEVKPVLCVDSPEGHIDEPVEEISVGPKDILSYSWRALRESSLLLHTTMSNITYGPRDDHGLKRPDFEKLGNSSFTQLAELRHRGAFSTVSQTFATCCQRCSNSKDLSIRELPQMWYQEAKSLIFQSSGMLTRRSAGLPALVTGILASNPGSPFFKSAMEGLFEISRLSVDYDKEEQYLKLPQVHAINCLKDIFTNTRIGPFTEPFIMDALTLSAERLGSPIWALRNSGLMLFRALLTRICRLTLSTKAGFGGSSGSEPGAKISFPKYTGLMELLSSLLAPSVGSIEYEGSDIVTERIFPALELIGEKIPSPEDDTDIILRGLVVEHFKSPVWGIREHAARVYASLMTREKILKDIRHILGLIGSDLTENLIHGVVLCFRYALRRFAATTDAFWISHIDELLETIRLAFDAVLEHAKSPFVATVLVEVLNDTIERGTDAGLDAQIVASVSTIFDEHELDASVRHVFDSSNQGWNLSPTVRSSSLLRRALALFLTVRKLVLEEKDLFEFYLGVSLFDPDVASWVCEQLQEKLGGKERFSKPLAHLYSSIILGKHRPDLQTIAAEGLASVIEALITIRSSEVAEICLPHADLLRSFQPEKRIELWNRRATDAELRLRGALLVIEISLNGMVICSEFEASIVSWTIKLQSAISEETEFTTRYAAVASLGSFASVLRLEGSPPRVDTVFLDLYLILYDMLNDDDEELRDMAAVSASWILSYSPVSPDAAVALGPLNASALLAKFVMTQYSGSKYFARRVIYYLTGQEPRISGSDRPHRLTPVNEMIAQYRQESTVLFVEEKQNLFIDEVREIDVWAQAFSYLHKTAIPRRLFSQAANWVDEGIQDLGRLLSSDAGKDGLLGWASKPEMFTLGIRLITVFSALTSPQFCMPKILDIEPQVLQQEFETLRQLGVSAALHDAWLARICSTLKGIESA